MPIGVNNLVKMFNKSNCLKWLMQKWSLLLKRYISHKNLKMIKVCEKNVWKVLTPTQKINYNQICADIFEQTEATPSLFESLITFKKTLIFQGNC